MLDGMSVLHGIEWFARLSGEARTLIFFGLVLFSALACFGSPLLLTNSKSSATQPKAAPNPNPNTPRPFVVTKQSKAQDAQFKTKSEKAVYKDVVSAPVQIDTVSSNSSGPVSAVIGNNIQPAKEFEGVQIFVLGGAPTINTYDGLKIQRKKIRVKTTTGGQADIEIYTLFNSASWSYRSSSKLVNSRDKDVDFESFLSSEKFIDEAREYQAIVCLGLASGSAQGDIKKTIVLSDDRATHLCGVISREIYDFAPAIKIFGLPLGYHQNTLVKKNSNEERDQRSIVILGIKSKSKSIESDAEQQLIISKILKNDGFDDFNSSNYSEVASGKPLRYLRIERGIYNSATQND